MALSIRRHRISYKKSIKRGLAISSLRPFLIPHFYLLFNKIIKPQIYIYIFKKLIEYTINIYDWKELMLNNCY